MNCVGSIYLLHIILINFIPHVLDKNNRLKIMQLTKLHSITGDLGFTLLREPIHKNIYTLSSTEENAQIRHLLIMIIHRLEQRRRGIIDNMAAMETQSMKRASSSKPRRYQTSILTSARNRLLMQSLWHRTPTM